MTIKELFNYLGAQMRKGTFDGDAIVVIYDPNDPDTDFVELMEEDLHFDSDDDTLYITCINDPISNEEEEEDEEDDEEEWSH